MDQFANTLAAPAPPPAAPAAVPTAFAPNSVAAPLPSAYAKYFGDQQGFMDHQVGANTAQAQGNIADANAATAAKQKIQDIQERIQKIKDLQDPSKYQQVRTKDGGFSYFDPAGKQVSLKQYSSITGKLPAQILKDSENVLDHQFLNDYKKLEDFMNATTSGDKKKVQEFQTAYPGLKGVTMDYVINNFKTHYPNVYGNPNDIYGGSRGQVGNSAFQ